MDRYVVFNIPYSRIISETIVYLGECEYGTDILAGHRSLVHFITLTRISFNHSAHELFNLNICTPGTYFVNARNDFRIVFMFNALALRIAIRNFLFTITIKDNQCQKWRKNKK